MKIFNEVTDNNKYKIDDLGVQLGDLGYHSNQNISTTMVAARYTVYPQIETIFLKGFWSIGPVNDNYLHYYKERDKYVGIKIIYSLILSTDFGFSTEYFDTEGREYGTEK